MCLSWAVAGMEKKCGEHFTQEAPTFIQNAQPPQRYHAELWSDGGGIDKKSVGAEAPDPQATRIFRRMIP